MTRFAALSGSNVSDYAAAGKAAGDSAAKSFDIARKYSPDYGDLSKVAMVTDASKFQAAAKASAKVATTGIKAYEQASILDSKIDQFNSRRKAGSLAAIGKIAGAGFLAATDNTKGRERPKADRKSVIDKFNANKDAINAKYDADSKAIPEFKPSVTTPATSTQSAGGSAGKTTGGSTSVAPPSTPTVSGSLSGNKKILADAIAKYESGDWGYEAFNQGGAAGGTKVLGKSGSHKNTFGRSLTDMTLGEIYHKQNTAQRGLSMSEHINTGGLHAVGRYQFIGPTLQAEAKRMGLSPDTKFTPQVQDDIFFNHIKRVGNISPWVGPSNNYSASQKQDFRNIISGL